MRLSRRVVALGAISALLGVGADARALSDERAVEPAVRAEPASGLAAPGEAAADFESWAARHAKSYESAEERIRRAAIFAENAAFVAKHNAEHERGEHSHWLGLNHLADLTREEFSKMLGYDRSLRSVSDRREPADPSDWEYADVRAPPEKDWVSEGAVTRVKNQGQCGSCWAFSTTGSVEGVNFIKTGSLVSVSEEELVSCSTKGNAGCDGGLMDNALDWIVRNGGIDSEDDWPYDAEKGRCGWFAKKFRRPVRIDGFTDVPPEDEDALEKAAAMQPVREVLSKVGAVGTRATQSAVGTPMRSPPRVRSALDLEAMDGSGMRKIGVEDFRSAIRIVGPSVSNDTATMSELRRWNETFGDGGSKASAPLTYFM